MVFEASTYCPGQLDDLLPQYYKRLFPDDLFCRWLGCGYDPKSYFALREFSFTLRDDVYVRYQSFNDVAEFTKELRRMLPHKIDIGAVYNHRPREHKSLSASAFQPQSKELVFDIDMTDYDDVRFCCSGADICSRCWPLMKMAVHILDRALREDFGFDQILWVYSGRRGIHCWVSDEVARKLSPAGRSAIADYLSLVKGGENNLKKVNLYSNAGHQHPSIESAVDILNTAFPNYVAAQGLLSDKQRIEPVLSLLPPEMASVHKDLMSRWHDTNDTDVMLQRWNTLLSFLDGQNSTLKKEIMLQFAYPRLDVHVTTGINHLLKSPFCIHPKTGRVCVPFLASAVDDFDPAIVPTISQLIDELGVTPDEEGAAIRRLHAYKTTSLRPYVEMFETFVRQIESRAKNERLEERDAAMEI